MNPPTPRNRAGSVALRWDQPVNRVTSVKRHPQRTYRDVSDCQLEALAEALGLHAEVPGYVALQRALFEPWASRRIPEHPPYPSMLADDHSPYEYSVAFGRDGVELRLLFEAQGETPSLEANHAAAERVNERLQRSFGVDFSRFESVRDLFLPEAPHPPFSLWHAVCLNPGKRPEFKIYLNPRAHGPANSRDVVREALRRLGFDRGTADALFQGAARRGDADELRYFSLDMSTGPTARVKVYFAHHEVNARELEDAFSTAPSHHRGDVEAFCDAIVGQRGPFVDKPVTSCFSFVANRDRPSAVTLHVPVAYYLDSDELASKRIRTYLDANGLAGHAYERALLALAQRPLDCGAGLQSYASYRREPTGMRCTVYISPELFTAHDEECSTTRMKIPAV